MPFSVIYLDSHDHEVMECDRCRALVLRERVDDHADWHIRIGDYEQ